MIFTNKANLPAPLVSALLYSDYDKVGDISVTSLILPPRIRQLMARHDAEITEDVSELIWRLIGSIGHKILERADTDNHLSEERITTRLHGWTISGKADLLASDMTLSDYKFTSVWAMKDAKAEWEQQLNLYALLYAKNGFLVKAARIVAVLRDWSKLKAAIERSKTPMIAGADGIYVNPPNYPQVGVVVRLVPLWSPEEQEAFLGLRVRAHQQAEKLADDDLPMCTPEERWHKPDIYAVKKKGGKRALKLFKDPVDARMWINPDDASLTVEQRSGEDTRCLHYCAVRQFCSYGKTLAPASEETEAA